MSPTPPGTPFGGYHRVSDVGSRDVDSESYTTERDAFARLDAWAAGSRMVIAKRYLDRDVTGSVMHRPAFDEMMRDLRAGVIEGVVVAQVDRLSRADVGDALAVVREICELAPGGFAALDLGVDPTTEFGEFGLTLLLALARLQWRRHKRGRDRTRELAVERGAFIGPTPIGYVRADGGRLVPDDDGGAAGHVREAFRRAASGPGGDVPAAMAYLRSALPVRFWDATSVRRVLTSRAYLGESHSGTFANTDAHTALVTFTQWIAAQPNGQRANSAWAGYPLSGLARCATCGGPLTGQMQRRTTRRGVVAQRRYRCGIRGIDTARCATGLFIDADDLDAYVLHGLRGVLADRTALDAGLPGDGLAVAQAALDAAEDERRSFAADVEAQAALGRAAWLAALAARREAVESATAALRGELALASTHDAVPALDDLDTLDAADCARALRAVGLTVIVQPGRASLHDRVEIRIAGFDDADDAAGVAAA